MATDYHPYPCIDCPGMPRSCRYGEKKQVCTQMSLSTERRVIQLLKRCVGLSTPGAYNILIQFSGPNEVIWPLKGRPAGLKAEIRLKTFVKSDDINWCMAKDVHFKFWGGPPNKLTYYNGSLETLLYDRVMAFADTYGVDEAEKVFEMGVETCGA